jgi:predicted membrane protein (TIGR00267 family)
VLQAAPFPVVRYWLLVSLLLWLEQSPWLWGAYIASKSEIDHHQSEIEREKREIEEKSAVEREEIRQIYMKKADFNEEELRLILNRITGDKKTWLDSMMKEELGLFKEHFEYPVKVGLVMLLAFTAGGLIPLLPFLLLSSPQTSFLAASIMTLASLFVIGVWETTFTSRHWLVSGLEMVTIGILAAGIPYLIGSLLLPMILSQIVS